MGTVTLNAVSKKTVSVNLHFAATYTLARWVCTVLKALSGNEILIKEQAKAADSLQWTHSDAVSCLVITSRHGVNGRFLQIKNQCEK
jgi:hypothetical protein